MSAILKLILALTWFLPLVSQATSAPGPRPDEAALIEAVRKHGGGSISGTWHPGLCEITREWARAMADRHACSTLPSGHDGFAHVPNSRSERALNATQTMAASEVIASTYGFETTLSEHANSCVIGWLGSPNHRVEVMNTHTFYCYSMEKSSDQKYYCIGIFTETEPPPPR